MQECNDKHCAQTLPHNSDDGASMRLGSRLSDAGRAARFDAVAARQIDAIWASLEPHMNTASTQELLQVVKSFAQRYIAGRLLATLLVGGLSLLALAFAARFEFSVQGQIFGTKFSVSYGSGTQIALPLFVGTVLVVSAVWIYLRSQRDPQSKRIENLEAAYAANGTKDSVQELFYETFGVHVRSGPELDHVMKLTNVRSIANSLGRAREHVRFLDGIGYVLTKPRLPYKAIEVTFTILYFACVVALVLVVPFAFTAVIQGDASLAMTSTAFIFILAGVAWASLSAYSSAFHALRLACGDA